MPKVKIPRFTEVQWNEKGQHLLEILISSQLFFLNNFSEPLCKKAKQVLKTVFDRLRLERDILIVGESVVNDQTGDIKYFTLFNPPGGLTD